LEILESHSLMGGRLQIVLFSGRKNYYARVYNPATRNRVARSLRTTDLAIATDRAIEVWAELQPLIEQGIPTDAQTLEGLVKQYLQQEQKRVDAGLVKPGTVRDKAAQLQPMLLFCQLNNLRKITDVKAYSFNKFTAWRRDESKRLTTGKPGLLEMSSLNKSIREVRAFFKWCRHQHLTDVELDMKEVTTRHEKSRKKNVAFTEKDMRWIEQELERWVIKEAQGPDWAVKRIRPIQWYSRHAFRYMFDILCLTGMRPTELLELTKWGDLDFRNRGDTEASRWLDPVVTIHLKNPTGKGSRTIVSNAGWILKKFKKYVMWFRHEHGYRSIKPSDPLFLYPNTEELYVYSHWGNQMRALIKRCRLEGKGYTIRSCRGWYVSQQLAKGVPPYLVAKNCGHSVEIMRSAYEQISEAQLMEALINS